MALYQKHRPQTLAQVVGQDAAVNTLRALGKSGKVPHAILLTGPSGTGKTTLARCICRAMGVANADLEEMNAANNNGVEVIRSIESRAGLAPLAGPARVYIVDEAHQLTTPAQQAFLKLLEDTPDHLYFILCTTHPQKLIPTVKTRCTEIALGPLNDNVLHALVAATMAAEGKNLTTDVIAAVVNAAAGSARKALVLAEQIMDIPDPEAQIAAVAHADAEKAAIDLCRALMGGKPTWSAIAAILRDMAPEPEEVRRAVLGYARSVLLKADNKRAVLIIESFQFNYFDSGAAGLALSAYRVVHG